GIYGAHFVDDQDYLNFAEEISSFHKRHGRNPRIYIAKMGQDGHDRGARIIASAFADIGFDVDVGPLFQTPIEVARAAMESDVHAIGVSSLAGGHNSLVPALIEELKSLDCEDIQVFCGGVIPQQDYKKLYDLGVIGIFGPGTPILESASKILTALDK
ncbi:cobalamin-dependent protein, partial [bacterium]|nr:cobalamin-dependent protein [bacterium]